MSWRRAWQSPQSPQSPRSPRSGRSGRSGRSVRSGHSGHSVRSGRSPLAGLLLGLAISLSMIGCVVSRLTGPRLTGTCEGACAHYVECKPGHADADRSRCTLECPGVFSDRDSLMAYESLSCDDAVEYVDGRTAKTAKTAAHH